MRTKIVTRYDYAQDAAKVERTAEGFLRTVGFVAQAGIMLYEDAEGNVTRELVEDDVLTNESSNASLVGKPFTIGHPPEIVTPDNWSELAVGTVLDNRFDKTTNKLRASVVVGAKKALDLAEAGTVQLSPAYTVTVETEGGVHPVYGEYDTRQKPDREYNHLALVDEARGGDELILRLDSAKQVTSKPDKAMFLKKPVKPVKKADNAAEDPDAPEQVEENTDSDYSPREDMKAMGEKMDSMIEKLDALVNALSNKDAADKPETEDEVAATAQRESDPKPKADARSFAAQYAERRRIEEYAENIGLALERAESASNEDLMRQVLAARVDAGDLKTLKADALRAAFKVVSNSTTSADYYAAATTESAPETRQAPKDMRAKLNNRRR